ncbi:MAG: hypothetical protein WAQ53_07965 [Thiofilum sp.]|uniref:hypothetical protein n=1 Tax=Thiofilum sp. TaxID=2212733 RepID=UPI0025EA109A|nr:hypothetical protein [Thiofilum sp.]MBK8454117.1 hypothetical protein [Thiofilum sp.]
MNKLLSYTSPFWVWLIAWVLIMNGAAHTLAQAITGDSLKGLGALLWEHLEQWKGLIL